MFNDYTKCTGENCPKKENCLRFTIATKFDKVISPPYDHEKRYCLLYLSNNPLFMTHAQRKELLND